MPPAYIGVGLKTYLGHADTLAWARRVADTVCAHDAIRSGRVVFFAVPTFPQLVPVRDVFAGTPVRVGAQDVSRYGPGPYTGEVTAAELAEIGVGLVEIGHIERRRLFAESSEVVAAKATAALSHGLTPLHCVGEIERADPPRAAAEVVAQLAADLRGAPDGPILVAYEPVWSIGVPEPAPAEHIAVVAGAIRSHLAATPGREGSSVIYGGSARPGILPRVGASLDGLILGRVGHEMENLLRVIDEADALRSAQDGASF